MIGFKSHEPSEMELLVQTASECPNRPNKLFWYDMGAWNGPPGHPGQFEKSCQFFLPKIGKLEFSDFEHLASNSDPSLGPGPQVPYIKRKLRFMRFF